MSCLAQFRRYYEDSGGTIRSIDIKEKIIERFPGKVSFCKPSEGDDKTTEYVLPSDTDILPKTIRAITTGEGISSCLQLKSVARSVSHELQSFPTCLWPPAPQAIIESTETVSKILYNFLTYVLRVYHYLSKISWSDICVQSQFRLLVDMLYNYDSIFLGVI